MWTSNYYGSWDIWNLYHKVTFDGPNRLILINYGETSIDFNVDIYSSWKEWVILQNDRNYSRYAFAMSVIGGEPIGNSQFIGATYFLENGWRIKPWEGSHNLDIQGNVYTREEGESPYANTDGNWKINITNRVSALVFKVETAASGSSTVTIDADQVAQAVWQYSVTGSMADETFGDHVYRKLLTLAQYMATK